MANYSLHVIRTLSEIGWRKKKLAQLAAYLKKEKKITLFFYPVILWLVIISIIWHHPILLVNLIKVDNRRKSCKSILVLVHVWKSFGNIVVKFIGLANQIRQAVYEMWSFKMLLEGGRGRKCCRSGFLSMRHIRVCKHDTLFLYPAENCIWILLGFWKTYYWSASASLSLSV